MNPVCSGGSLLGLREAEKIVLNSNSDYYINNQKVACVDGLIRNVASITIQNPKVHYFSNGIIYFFGG